MYVCIDSVMAAEQTRAKALFPQAPLGDPGHLRVACFVVQQPVGLSISMVTFTGPLAGLLNA